MLMTFQSNDIQRSIYDLFLYPKKHRVKRMKENYYFYFALNSLKIFWMFEIIWLQLLTKREISINPKTSNTTFNKFNGNHEDANTTTIETSNAWVLACFFIFSWSLEFCKAMALSLGLRALVLRDIGSVKDALQWVWNLSTESLWTRTVSIVPDPIVLSKNFVAENSKIT